MCERDRCTTVAVRVFEGFSARWRLRVVSGLFLKRGADRLNTRYKSLKPPTNSHTLGARRGAHPELSIH